MYKYIFLILFIFISCSNNKIVKRTIIEKNPFTVTSNKEYILNSVDIHKIHRDSNKYILSNKYNKIDLDSVKTTFKTTIYIDNDSLLFIMDSVKVSGERKEKIITEEISNICKCNWKLYIFIGIIIGLLIIRIFK